MKRIFGTDGVRGIANRTLTPQLAFKLGRAGAKVLSSEDNHSPVIVIGKDTRISGDMLEDALSAGIQSAGGSVIKAGVVPTPAVAYLVGALGADAGAVISASHNPYEYNGIKFFSGTGFKLSDELEDEIQKHLDDDMTGESIGRVISGNDDVKKMYTDHLLSTIDIRLEGMKIVLDCANGAAYETAPAVYRALGADVTVIADEPDGVNINDGCGSTHPEKLCAKVLETGADIGLAFDGDADRLIAVDEKGRVTDGDKVICICARLLMEQGMLDGNLVTGTVMSNLGFHKYLEGIGCRTVSTAVGDRYVLESMLETGGKIGGEQSGHIIMLDYGTTGDGTLASLQLVKALHMFGKPLSELADEITLYPQVLVNASVKNENKSVYMDDEEVRNAIEEVEKAMMGDGRVLIRPSGTEPLVRVMIEGSDTDKIAAYAESIASLLEEKFA